MKGDFGWTLYNQLAVLYTETKALVACLKHFLYLSLFSDWRQDCWRWKSASWWRLLTCSASFYGSTSLFFYLHFLLLYLLFMPPFRIFNMLSDCITEDLRSCNAEFKNIRPLNLNSDHLIKRERTQQIMQNFAKALWSVLKEHNEKLKVIVRGGLMF